jgi:hypothetical protein
MFYWIYEIPTLLVIGLFAVVFVGVCWIGTIVLSPLLRPWVHEQRGLNEILGDFLQYFGVIYGLLLGLLAVATYQNFTDVEKAVANEASALAGLYRDVTAYPEPDRTELEDVIREYTRSTIEDAWPLQRQGIDPWKVNRAAPIFARLARFEPQTKAQEALHDTALRQFNEFFQYRRMRLYFVSAGIPAVMWYTVAVGAIINMILIWLFDLRLGIHLMLGGGHLLLHRHHDLPDCTAGQSVPRRSERVAASVRVDLQPDDEGVSVSAQAARSRCPRRCRPHGVLVEG